MDVDDRAASQVALVADRSQMKVPRAAHFRPAAEPHLIDPASGRANGQRRYRADGVRLLSDDRLKTSLLEKPSLCGTWR